MQPTIFLAVLFALAFRVVGAEKAAPFGYYELHIYSVTSNKLDAVQERFRDTVEPVRRKHEITTIGYWTARAETNDTFVYLKGADSKEELQRKNKNFGADPEFKAGYSALTAKHGKTVDKIVTLPLSVADSTKFDFTSSATPRVFDLRLYTVLPGKLEAFCNRWRDSAIPIYARHGLQSVGWWVADKKGEDGAEMFVVLLAGESVEAIQKSITAFHQDAEWQRVEKETERDGKLRRGVEAFKLRPTDFSRLK